MLLYTICNILKRISIKKNKGLEHSPLNCKNIDYCPVFKGGWKNHRGVLSVGVLLSPRGCAPPHP